MKKLIWKAFVILTAMASLAGSAVPVHGYDLCTKAGCRNERLTGSRYCEEHECAVSGCHFERCDGTAYCRTHKDKYKYNTICMEPGCGSRQKDGSLYCYRHTCTKPGCTSKRMNGSDYCSSHTPDAVKSRLSESAKPEKKNTSGYWDDPYDVWDYVDGDDFASDWEDSGDFEDYDDAMDYYEEVVGHD